MFTHLVNANMMATTTTRCYPSWKYRRMGRKDIRSGITHMEGTRNIRWERGKGSKVRNLGVKIVTPFVSEGIVPTSIERKETKHLTA